MRERVGSTTIHVIGAAVEIKPRSLRSEPMKKIGSPVGMTISLGCPEVGEEGFPLGGGLLRDAASGLPYGSGTCGLQESEQFWEIGEEKRKVRWLREKSCRAGAQRFPRIISG